MMFSNPTAEDLDDVIQRLTKGIRLEPERLTPDHLAHMTRDEITDRIERLHFHIIHYPSIKRHGAVLAVWYAEVALLSLKAEELRMANVDVMTYVDP